MASFSVLLLASGLSRRFGVADKLGADLGGVSLARRSARAFTTLDADRRIAVVADLAGAVARDLAADGFALVRNPAPERGQGHALACGAAAISDDSAVLIGLADMPFVRPEHLTRLLTAHEHANPAAVTIACADGRRSPPVLFGPAHLDTLRALDGDDGGRAVMRGASDIREVDLPEAALRDIDTPEDLALARQELAPHG